MLKYTEIDFEMLINDDMLLFAELEIREELSEYSHRHVHWNN
jgi:hypothetical protein